MTAGGSNRLRGFESDAVADVFAAYPARLRKRLLFLRQLILDVAAYTDGVGPLQGNRSILLEETDNVPVAALKHCIAMALTYHRRKPAAHPRAKPRKVTRR